MDFSGNNTISAVGEFVKSKISGKADSSHTHVQADITDFSGCVYGTSTAVRVELGFKASAVIIADTNSPTTLYVPNAISATAFACTAIPEGTVRRYWAFK